MLANQPIARIHLDNIKTNLELARKLSPHAKPMAVIKANAYGHGIEQVSEALSSADAFAVARVSEAVQLRTFQPQKTIVVLEGFLDVEEAEACRENQLTPVVHSQYQIELLGKELPFWLKFNTGMFRLGFNPNNAQSISERLAGYNLVGVMTHFANADDPAHELNQQQVERYAECMKHFPNAAECLSNSGAIMQLPEVFDSWIRPGLMMYGGAPEASPNPDLLPGMTLSAPVISINHLQAGDSVGYGSTWQATEKTRIAVVAFGYADGYPRETPAGTPILLKGVRRKLVGRVSMDMCTVLLEDGDEVLPGDACVFWGEGLPIDEVAACAGTISYTLMTGLGRRVQREYN